jgi:hypothetical protein
MNYDPGVNNAERQWRLHQRIVELQLDSEHVGERGSYRAP